MANDNKNILITPAKNLADQPTIEFKGFDVNNSNIKLVVTDDGSLSFEGGAGQLFSITDNLDGTLFSVNDVSGIPSIEVLDNGDIKLAEFGGNVTVNGVSVVKYYEQADEPTTAVSGDLWRDTDTGVTSRLFVDGTSRVWMEA